ncbi:MAG TPA: aminoglycoside phosphotransferase family protein [Streptosporangiaceae bacterium]|nr:aminoglycoside phosphotransferase family protein [Streptosporangiaceae bacterium]
MTHELTESSARVLLEQACVIGGLSADGARLLRMGSNAVYHLADPVVVRISRHDADIDHARRTIAVARWLESVDYPAVRAIDIDQPIVIDGHVITFWQSVSDDGQQYATVGEVAEVLARLHRLVAPADLRLPALAPFENAAKRITASSWLSPGDREFLTEHLTRMQDEYAGLEFTLPQGLIHGDASIGNVLHDFQDNPVVIDLDGFATGPKEWDLALTAIYYDSFGWHTRQEYETFVRVYGFDIMQWPGYPVMRAVREFLMVTWVIQKAGESERVAAEASKRIAALRTGASRKDWQPY